jgi:hypothetical protein
MLTVKLQFLLTGLHVFETLLRPGKLQHIPQDEMQNPEPNIMLCSRYTWNNQIPEEIPTW